MEFLSDSQDLIINVAEKIKMLRTKKIFIEYYQKTTGMMPFNNLVIPSIWRFIFSKESKVR